MNIFKISCHSVCGTYFASYLQSVTVIASDESEAFEKVNAWLKENDRAFLYPQDKWRISKLGPFEHGVFDWFQDSDY